MSSNKMALDALTEYQWLELAKRHANKDWDCAESDGYLNAVKALCADFAAIAALQASPQGWRPIETAPKDAHALLWIDIAIGQPLVVQGCWFHDDDADEKGWIDLDGNVLNATHWMPLPSTPPKD